MRELDSEIVLTTPLGSARAVVPAPGLHNVRNALAASAAATALAVPTATVAAGLAHFGGVKGRLQRKSGLHGATLIDDTYNANPDSVRAAIAVLAQARGKAAGARRHGRTRTRRGRHACGNRRIRAQRRGHAPVHAGRIVGARDAGIRRGARHFTRIEDLLAEIENVLAPDVTLLVKGSRFMQMERVVKALWQRATADGAGEELRRPCELAPDSPSPRPRSIADWRSSCC